MVDKTLFVGLKNNLIIASTCEEIQMGIDEIEIEIRKLPLKDRAALAKWIVESLDELSESEIEALWAEEAERRLDELEQGLVTDISAEETLHRARAAIS
jgi:putative addiction module component (TIGR02574 family)